MKLASLAHLRAAVGTSTLYGAGTVSVDRIALAELLAEYEREHPQVSAHMQEFASALRAAHRGADLDG